MMSPILSKSFSVVLAFLMLVQTIASILHSPVLEQISSHTHGLHHIDMVYHDHIIAHQHVNDTSSDKHNSHHDEADSHHCYHGNINSSALTTVVQCPLYLTRTAPIFVDFPFNIYINPDLNPDLEPPIS